MPGRKYSDAEKAAYYKKLAQGAKPQSKKAYSNKSWLSQNNRFVRNYNKPYAYPGVGSAIGGALGHYAGTAVGGPVGGMAGHALGRAVGQGAHSLVKTVTGYGDYEIKKNSLVFNKDAVPEFSIKNKRCTMVSHREFISDVKSSINFVNREFRINPAIAQTFPWLAGIAQNYEQYVVQGMLFEFKTTSATAIGSTNTSLGTVVLATQYNSLAEDFINKQQMENYEYSQSSVPSQSILHAIECDPTQTQCSGIFNMYNPSDQSGDNRLYDIGRFNIATVGMQQADVTIGELWVTYKICLLKPRLQSVTESADGYRLDSVSITPANPLGNIFIPFSGNDNFTTIVGPNLNQIQIDPTFVGILEVMAIYRVRTTAGYIIGPNVDVAVGNIVNKSAQYLNNGVPSTIISAVDTAMLALGGDYIYSYGIFQCNGGFDALGNPPTVVVGNMTTSGAFTLQPDQCRLFVTAYPSSFQP